MLRLGIKSSMAHLFANAPFNANRIERATKKHFSLGSAVHHVICAEPDFARYFAVRPLELDGKPFDMRRTVCKQWVREHEQAGRTVLNDEDVRNITGMAVAIGENPLVQEGLLNGGVERSLFWRDLETQLWLKSRPDVLPHASADFVDIKTTQSVLYRDIQRTVADFGYYQQAALALEVAAKLDMEISSFSLLFVEKEAPWCVRVVAVKR